MDKQKKKQLNIHRIIAFMLVVSLSVSSMFVQAEAAGSEKMMVDLLTASSYTYLINGSTAGSGTDPAMYFSGVTNAAWQWQVTTDYIFGYCYFTVYCSTKPDRMQVKYYPSQKFTDAEYVGNNGNLYQYRVKCGTNNAYIRVQGTWNSGYYGNFGVYSFVGVKDFSESVSKVDLSHNAWRLMYNTGDVVIYPYGSHDGVSLPFNKTSTFTVTGYKWQSSVCNIDIKPDYRAYNHVSEVSFLLSGYGLSNFSIQLMDSMKTAVYVIDPEDAAVVANTTLVYGEDDQPVIYYQVTADLSEYDLEDLTIRLTFSASPYDKNDTQQYIDYTVMDCYLKPYIEEVPWYKTFWNWLSDKWDTVTSSIKSSISSAADKITSAINNLFGNSETSEELSSAGDDLSNQAGDVDNAASAMDSVEQPEIDGADLVGGYANFDTNGLNILSMLTSNRYATDMMIVVFTFCLCGYIFFGKKG